VEGSAQKRSNRAQAVREHELEGVFFSRSWKCYPPLEENKGKKRDMKSRFFS
jgi:hypothetical protein